MTAFEIAVNLNHTGTEIPLYRKSREAGLEETFGCVNFAPWMIVQLQAHPTVLTEYLQGLYCIYTYD